MSSLPGITLEQWAVAFLDVLVLPKTEENVRAVVSWARAESGDPPMAAMWNPLNTTQDYPGATDFNSNDGDPVKNYPTMRAGLTANAQAMTNGDYAAVLAALEQGDNAQAVADAVTSSPWGTRAIVLVPPISVPSPSPVKPVMEDDDMILMAPARLQHDPNRPVFAWVDSANKHIWTHGHRLTVPQFSGADGSFVAGIPSTTAVRGADPNCSGQETITVGAEPADGSGAPAFHFTWAP